MSMIFGFKQSVEVHQESNRGLGTITLKNMDFILVAEPVLESSDLKVNIKRHNLQIGEYDVELKGQPGKTS